MFEEECAYTSPLMGISHGKGYLGMRGGFVILNNPKIAAHAYNVLLLPFLERRDESRIPREVQFGKVVQLLVGEPLLGLEKAKIDRMAT
jgi:hypothetical protein